MRITISTLTKSFSYALKGMRYTFRHEQNFRMQLIVALVVVALMFLFRVKPWEVVALTFVIMSVLILEIANTIVERLVDLLKPRLNHYSALIKDLMAAVVLLASIGSLVVGAIIFIPYVTALLR